MAAGFPTATEAVTRFGWNISTYRAHENGQNQYDAKQAILYAEAYRTSAAWLLTGENDLKTNITKKEPGLFTPVIKKNESLTSIGQHVLVISLLGDGYWIDDAIINENDKLEHSPIPPDPRFPICDQFDMKVKGPSCEPTISDGEYIRCLKQHNEEAFPSDGELLVIKKTQGSLREYSLRQVQQHLDDISLNPLDRNNKNYSSYTFRRDELLTGHNIKVVGKILYKFKILSRSLIHN